MTQEDREEFARQLKGCQALAEHRGKVITGIHWKGGHLFADMAGKGDAAPVAIGEAKVLEFAPAKPKRKKPEQLGLL